MFLEKFSVFFSFFTEKFENKTKSLHTRQGQIINDTVDDGENVNRRKVYQCNFGNNSVTVNVLRLFMYGSYVNWKNKNKFTKTTQHRGFSRSMNARKLSEASE